MRNIGIMFIIGVLAAVAGCTWVSPSPEAKQQGIMVLPQDRVANCRLLSKTQVSVADKVGFINRVQADVDKDLQNLAMNQAATQGGDTVSALTAVNDGGQTFGIYKCLGAHAADATSAPSAVSAIKTTPYQPPR